MLNIGYDLGGQIHGRIVRALALPKLRWFSCLDNFFFNS